MTTDLAGFAKQCRTAAARIERAQRQTSLAVGRIMQAEVDEQLARAGVTDGRLRNVGKKGAKIGTVVKPGQQGTVVVRATGPFHLIERPTKKHTLTTRAATRRVQAQAQTSAGKTVRAGASKGAKALSINGAARASAKHPGTRGKHPFERATHTAAPKIAAATAAHLRGEFAATFR